MMNQNNICVYIWCFSHWRGSVRDSWMLDSIVMWPRHDQTQVTGFNVPAQSLYLALRRLPRLTYYVHTYHSACCLWRFFNFNLCMEQIKLCILKMFLFIYCARIINYRFSVKSSSKTGLRLSLKDLRRVRKKDLRDNGTGQQYVNELLSASWTRTNKPTHSPALNNAWQKNGAYFQIGPLCYNCDLMYADSPSQITKIPISKTYLIPIRWPLLH